MVTFDSAMTPGNWKTSDFPLPVGIDTQTEISTAILHLTTQSSRIGNNSRAFIWLNSAKLNLNTTFDITPVHGDYLLSGLLGRSKQDELVV